MHNRKKLIELFIYIAIVLVGITLLVTSNMKETPKEQTNIGGMLYAAVFNE